MAWRWYIESQASYKYTAGQQEQSAHMVAKCRS